MPEQNYCTALGVRAARGNNWAILRGDEMIREAAALLMIGLLLLFVYLRKKHYGYALAVIPVCLIPAVHLLINLILFFTQGAFFGIRPSVVIAFTDFLALGGTCMIVVRVAQRIGSKRNRLVYSVVMLVYCVLLGWAFLFNSISTVIETTV